MLSRTSNSKLNVVGNARRDSASSIPVLVACAAGVDKKTASALVPVTNIFITPTHVSFYSNAVYRPTAVNQVKQYHDDTKSVFFSQPLS